MGTDSDVCWLGVRQKQVGRWGDGNSIREQKKGSGLGRTDSDPSAVRGNFHLQTPSTGLGLGLVEAVSDIQVGVTPLSGSLAQVRSLGNLVAVAIMAHLRNVCHLGVVQPYEVRVISIPVPNS